MNKKINDMEQYPRITGTHGPTDYTNVTLAYDEFGRELAPCGCLARTLPPAGQLKFPLIWYQGIW